MMSPTFGLDIDSVVRISSKKRAVLLAISLQGYEGYRCPDLRQALEEELEG